MRWQERAPERTGSLPTKKMPLWSLTEPKTNGNTAVFMLSVHTAVHVFVQFTNNHKQLIECCFLFFSLNFGLYESDNALLNEHWWELSGADSQNYEKQPQLHYWLNHAGVPETRLLVWLQRFMHRSLRWRCGWWEDIRSWADCHGCQKAHYTEHYSSLSKGDRGEQESYRDASFFGLVWTWLVLNLITCGDLDLWPFSMRFFLFPVSSNLSCLSECGVSVCFGHF